MANNLKKAFSPDIISLNVEDVIYSKELPKHLNKSPKFAAIVSSIKEVGIIEPPVVVLKNGKYFLLDGHLRITALKKLEIKEVLCLISTDDEAFTYNKHVNRVSNVQEHKMLTKAIENGASMERIARGLNVNVASIVRRKNMLAGICQEAIDLLSDKMVSKTVFMYMKKMKPPRQIEAANLMNDSKNYTSRFVRAIWQASPDSQLVNPIKRKVEIDSGAMNRLESEVVRLQGEFKIIEDNYGLDVLNLTLTKGYLKLLLGNSRVVRYLQSNAGDILQEFEDITDLKSLDTQ